MADLTRREFVKTTLAAGAALTLGAGCSEPEPIVETGVPQGRVTLVRAETPDAAIARGIELMDGFSFIEAGQTVMLKPNMTGPLPPPDVTSPEVLTALIRQCIALGAGEVIVAERTAYQLATTTSFDLPVYDGRGMQEWVEEMEHGAS